MKTTWIFGALCFMGVLGCSGPNRTVPTPLNQMATLNGNLPYNPLQWKIVNSAISRNDGKVYTVFANPTASAYARSNAEDGYPVGSTLALVTWNQQGDPRWFGGLISETVSSVEFVTVEAGIDQRPQYLYTEFGGNPLKLITSQFEAFPSGRAAYLLSQRAAFMP